MRRRTKIGVLVAAAVLVGGLALFQPWRLFTRSTVDEVVPVAAVSATGAPATGTRTLASGSFVAGEHATSGRARILEVADGARFLRLEGFSTSDGPDVHVWLTDQAAGGGDWGKYDDGRYVPLGVLKATDGNQNYAIPAGAQLDGLTSVVIWCDRFNVAFGSAQLAFET